MNLTRAGKDCAERAYLDGAVGCARIYPAAARHNAVDAVLVAQ